MDNNFQILNELKKFLIENVNNGVDKTECQHEEVVTELSVKV